MYRGCQKAEDKRTAGKVTTEDTRVTQVKEMNCWSMEQEESKEKMKDD
jgi:hypothetical protein